MTTDDIFDSDCQAIVNTINCVGVMGGGLAKQFRLRYPDMNRDYQNACSRGLVRIGQMWNWYSSEDNRWIINFPTKLDWRHPSKLSYVVEGLVDLRKSVEDLKTSVAIPPLGCGLGGLDWLFVEPLITGTLKDLSTRVDIYPPDGPKYTLQKEEGDDGRKAVDSQSP